MLVAGTTGSGKSETIISYLVGLCIKFRPDEINLMLVDMKGEGFVGRIGDLPHVVGKVTDVDGDDGGMGAVYTLKRFLNSLTAEIRRRKVLFKKMSVDSIDKYIFACNNLEKHIEDNLSEEIVGNGKTVAQVLAERATGNPKDNEKTIREIIPKSKRLREMSRVSKEEKLTHLILVIDEFTELKRFSNENSDIDFIGEITTIARIGRSLGLHIILISQNIEGAITEDIRVNSKSRLCLRVATRQASKEMIHTDLAASPSMPGNGRAYLLVGTGSRFEYFQSAYSGANASSSDDIPVTITEASKTGKYDTFYYSVDDNETLKEVSKQDRRTQLSVIVSGIKSFYKERGCCKPHIVFQPPLPKKAIYTNGTVVNITDDSSNKEEV
jgi:S-DNA-T family DNA segregation ATPase FtsK/SpoIIIE